MTWTHAFDLIYCATVLAFIAYAGWLEVRHCPCGADIVFGRYCDECREQVGA